MLYKVERAPGKKRAKDRRKTKALRRGASRTVMEDISDAASINLLIEVKCYSYHLPP